MTLDVEKKTFHKNISELSLFVKELDSCYTRKEIINHILHGINAILNPMFSSFVERDMGILKTVDQTGDDISLKKIVTDNMYFEIYDWVIKQKQLAILKLSESDQFIFVPVIDYVEKEIVEHGMLVLNINNPEFDLRKEHISTINLLVKVTAICLTKHLKLKDANDYSKLQEEIRQELLMVRKLKKTISKESKSSKLNYNIIERDTLTFGGNVWYVCDISVDEVLVFIGQLSNKGLQASLIAGYVLGELESLGQNKKASIKPKTVLKYLNEGLNKVFRSTGISLDSWCGVFNTVTRNVVFADAKYPSPFLIWPEQHISNLQGLNAGENNSLGVNLNTVYEEACFEFPLRSKLVICNKYLLEAASRVGYRYDPSWLPQVLETIGGLSLGDLTNSLKSILSENITGTGNLYSRHALILEIIS